MEGQERRPQRLDTDKIEVLRRWGDGLAESGRDDEMRAAGRAILLLVEELDALQRDLWHARAHVSDQLPTGAEPAPEPAAAEGATEQSFLGALARRLGSAAPLEQ
jgi:hypothetical protein